MLRVAAFDNTSIRVRMHRIMVGRYVVIIKKLALSVSEAIAYLLLSFIATRRFVRKVVVVD